MKLVLNPSPTFKAVVRIPIAGGGEAEVEFEFKHRTRTALQAWMDVRDRSDVDTILEAACGWELAEPFDAKNVGILLENYGGSAFAVINTYWRELLAAREKN